MTYVVLQVMGVQVGAVQPLQVGEQRVMSGIRKQAARGPVAVAALGLAGDGQAFEIVAGPRETPLTTLSRSVRSRHG